MDADAGSDKEGYEAIPTGGEVCCNKACSKCVVNHFSIFNIIFYESTATAFFTYLVFIFGGTTTAPGVFITIFGMFVSLLWAARFTGSFMNPAVVIACMIKKERKIPLVKGLVMIGVEFISAFIGAIIAWVVSGQLPQPIQDNTDLDNTVLIFARQVIGTFLYIVITLILVSSDTTFVEMEIQIWFTMPLILIEVCELVQLPLGTNPAWGLAYNITYGIDQGNFGFMVTTWSIIVGPFVGAFLGGLFFEFLFRRFILAYLMEMKREEELMLARLNEAQRAQQQFKARLSVLELV